MNTNATRLSTAAVSCPSRAYQYRRSVSVRSAASTIRQGYYGENADDAPEFGAEFAAQPVVPTVSYYDGEDSFSASRSSQSVYLNDSFYQSEMEKAGTKSSIQPIGGPSSKEGSMRRSNLPTKRLVAKAVGAFERVVKRNATLEYNRELVQLMLGEGRIRDGSLPQPGAGSKQRVWSALEHLSEYKAGE